MPLSRWSLSELTNHVVQNGWVAILSQATLWRWLHQDAQSCVARLQGRYPNLRVVHGPTRAEAMAARNSYLEITGPNRGCPIWRNRS